MWLVSLQARLPQAGWTGSAVVGEGCVGLCRTLGSGGKVDVVLGEEGSVEWLGSFNSD